MKSKGLYGKKYLDIEERMIDIAPPDEDHVIVKVPVKSCYKIPARTDMKLRRMNC